MKPLHAPPKQTQSQVPSSVIRLLSPASAKRSEDRPASAKAGIQAPYSCLRTTNPQLRTLLPSDFCMYLFVQNCSVFFKRFAAPCTAFCNFLESFADFAPFRNFSKNDPHFQPKKRVQTRTPALFPRKSPSTLPI